MLVEHMLLRPFMTTMLIGAALLSMSCASLSIGSNKEPSVIVIRNRSGADITTVTLRESSWFARRESRFGSISPVPKGVSQEIGRPTDPPVFPRTVAVEWVDNEGRDHLRKLPLAKALKDATGGRGEALVFEIGPFEDVLVYIENNPK
jgi:hypothetical protein